MWSFQYWLMPIFFVLAISNAQFSEQGPNQWADPNSPGSGPELQGPGPAQNDPNSVGLKTKALFPRLFKHGLNWIKRHWIKPHWAQPAWLHPNGQKPNWSNFGNPGFFPSPHGPKPNWMNNPNQQNPNWGNPNLNAPRPNSINPNQGGPNPNQGRPNQNSINPNQGGTDPNQGRPNQGWMDPNQNQPDQNLNNPDQGGEGFDDSGDSGTNQDVFPPNSQDSNQDTPNSDFLSDNNLDGTELDSSALNPDEINSIDTESIPEEPDTLDRDITSVNPDWRNSNSAQPSLRRTNPNVNIRKPRWTRPLQPYPGHHKGYKPFARPRPIPRRPDINGSKRWNISPGRSNPIRKSNTGSSRLNKWNQLE